MIIYYQLSRNDLEVKCRRQKSLALILLTFNKKYIISKDIFSIVEMKIDKEDLNGMAFGYKNRSRAKLLAEGLNPNMKYMMRCRRYGFSHRQKRKNLNLKVKQSLLYCTKEKY